VSEIPEGFELVDIPEGFEEIPSERPLEGMPISGESQVSPQDISDELTTRAYEQPVEEPKGALGTFASEVGTGVQELAGGFGQRMTEGLLKVNEYNTQNMIDDYLDGKIDSNKENLDKIMKMQKHGQKLRRLLAVGEGQTKGLREEARPGREAHPIASALGNITGQTLALPGGMGKAAATVPARIAQAATTGAVAGGIQPTVGDESAVNNALIGAGFGAGMSGIAEAALPMVKRVINAKQGKFESSDMQQMVAQAEKEGIDVFAPDVTQGGFLKKASTVAEEFGPLGPANERLKQNLQQMEAAKKLTTEFGDNFDDLAATAQQGMKDQIKTFRDRASKKFDAASDALNPRGDVPLSHFDTELDALVEKELARGSLANQDLIETLQKFKEAPRGDFATTRDIRKVLGNDISDYYQGGKNQVIGQEGAASLGTLKRALEDDLETFAATSGGKEGLAAFRKANAYYQKNVVPFKKAEISKLVKTDEPEAIIKYLTQYKAEGGRTTRANKVCNAMDDKGKEAIRGMLVRNAFEKGFDDTNRAFSAAKFATEMERVSNITGVFFKPSDKKRIDGLAKIMRHTERAGQVAENPPTGARLLLPGLVTTSTAGVAVGFPLAFKALFHSKLGRDLLLASSKASAGSKKFQNIEKRMNALVTKAIVRDNESRKPKKTPKFSDMKAL
jgi:hypothetical protein